MKYKSAIDIGSNTTLLLILDEKNKQAVFESRVTQLGKNLDVKSEFEQRSMDLTFKALKEYVQICIEYQISPPQMKVTATEASRVAKNAPDFFKKIKNELGLEIVIISSDKEAYLASLGVVRGEGLDHGINHELTLMDIGGGSTELIKVCTNPFRIISSISLPIGSVRVTDWMQKGIWSDKKKEMLKNFHLTPYKTQRLIGVAGTMTSLINMVRGYKDFSFIDFNDSLLTLHDLISHFKPLLSKSSEEIEDIYPYLGARSEAIIGGFEVCKFFSENLEVVDFQISFKGLVHGSIFENEA